MPRFVQCFPSLQKILAERRRLAMNVRPHHLLTALLALAVLSLSSCAASNVLYQNRTPEGAVIVTQDGNGLRTLLFEPGGARQSVVKPGDPDHLELPYAKAALVALALSERRERMLIVGLGGGTLPMFLRAHYPAAQIDVVDINPEVVKVAKAYFGFREDGRLRAHVGDGRRFIEAARPGAYDLIFLDAYGADSVPAHLTTREFLQAVRRALDPRGVVMGNVWGRGSNALYDAMVRTYQDAFDDLYIVSVLGDVNNILLALPRRETLSQAELAERARRVSSAGRFRFDLGDVVNAGFLHARARNPRARVLADEALTPAR